MNFCEYKRRLRVWRWVAASTVALTTLMFGVAGTSSADRSVDPALSRAAASRSDFNGDGFDDLAIGSSADLPTLERLDVGVVQVLYGSSGGLTTAGAQVWTQDSPGVSGIAEGEEFFGSELACGDFDGDGFDDLAIAAPYETINDVSHAGVVHILFGSRAGLSADRDQLWSQQSAGVPGSPEEGDLFGSSLAVGDFDGSGHDDLVIGVRGEHVGQVGGAGAVQVLFGSTPGLTSANNQLWHQGSAGVPGVPEAGDQFGYSLAAADLGRGPQADLVVGVPYESIGRVNGAGVVHLFYGGPKGLVAAASQLWSQGSAGIAGAPEEFDGFGHSVIAANFGRGPQADVAIGADNESLGSIKSAGSVHVLYGTSNGVTATSSQTWNQQSRNILGVPEAYDQFGSSLAAASFSRGSYADLAVGVPYESLHRRWGSGALQVIHGSSSGLTAAANQLWTQNSPGIPDTAEAGDGWGTDLAVGNYGFSPQSDLAVTAIGEQGGPGVYGAVHVLPGSPAGLTGADSQRWTKQSPGIPTLPGLSQTSFGQTLPGS